MALWPIYSLARSDRRYQTYSKEDDGIDHDYTSAKPGQGDVRNFQKRSMTELWISFLVTIV